MTLTNNIQEKWQAWLDRQPPEYRERFIIAAIAHRHGANVIRNPNFPDTPETLERNERVAREYFRMVPYRKSEAPA